MTKKIFCLLLIILTLGLIFLPAHPAFAKTEEEYAKEIADLEAKISAAQQTSQTLAGQIAYYDGQISLTSLKISQTEELITSITSKILLLEDKLQSRSEVLEKQIVQTYKQGSIDPMQILFSSTSFSEIISRFKYSQLLQLNNRKFLHDTQKVQSNYGQQKTLIEDSKKRLIAQQTSLASLRKDRDRLLSQTRNDEATYQKLLSQAIAERDSFRAFAHAKGGNILPPQPQPDGWFFSQRDERWGNQCIGTTCSNSPSFVWEVGCLITSIAMMQKKNGVDTNPGVIARNSSYFFQDLMLIPWPAQPGFKFTNYGRDLNIINSELSAGRPVVVQIRTTSTSYGRHFIVIKGKSGSNYMMNDPWEGYDLVFQNFYSTGNILTVSTYQKT